MLYALEQGRVEQQIIHQCVKSGRPLPDAIADAPELRFGLGLYYDAFMELSTCRAVGMALGPIPWLAINSYANDLEIYGDQREDMYYHIRQLDNAYLDHQAKKSKD